MDVSSVNFEAVERLLLGPMAPAGELKRVVRVLAQHEMNSEKIHWIIQVSPAPDIPVPEAVLDVDRRLGGVIGLLKILVPLWGAAPLAMLSVEYLLPFTEGQLSFIPYQNASSVLPSDLQGLGRTAMVESIGVRFEDGAAGIGELTGMFLHESGDFLLNVLSNVPIRLFGGSEVLPEIDQLAVLLHSKVVVHPLQVEGAQA